jgi:hypothetical protein
VCLAKNWPLGQVRDVCLEQKGTDGDALFGAVPNRKRARYFLKRFSKAWRASVWRGGPAGGAEPGAAG